VSMVDVLVADLCSSVALAFRTNFGCLSSDPRPLFLACWLCLPGFTLKTLLPFVEPRSASVRVGSSWVGKAKSW